MLKARQPWQITPPSKSWHNPSVHPTKQASKQASIPQNNTTEITNLTRLTQHRPALPFLSTMSASTDPQTNSRGIPLAPFVGEVEKYVDSREDIERNLRKFQEMIAKYQFMEVNTQRRAGGLKDKIPDIQKTLDTVSFLKGRKFLRTGRRKDEGSVNVNGWMDKQSSSKPFEATFELNDTLYARANIPATEEVYLWLGANVMLSYPIDEATTLLKGKLEAAKESLRNCEEDMDFLRQQITTLEVNTARLYNYEVTLKRKEREEAEREEKGKKGGK
ncbi:unnamed protein product [Tuber aestivum]|uniref:Prefoldin subunit 3 n=1 Tax=Tuber aestivum TaxID=59557 RepID=A0A292PNQ2_9PEZI|nr:unnamed protein product [Tuber aestivum]